MDVSVLDRSAVLGSSPLHHASPGAKLASVALLLGSVLVAQDPLVVAGIALAIVAAAVTQRLPLRPLLLLAFYPAFFAAVFAFAAAPGPVTAALIVFKAITASLTVVTLMLTTPYPQVFAPLQRVTPTIVGDAMLMTYRSLFILADKFGDLTRAARLRAGVSVRQPVRGARTTVRALGGLLLYSLDLSQREYEILRLRGYEGRLRVSPQRGTAPSASIAVLALASLALLASIAFRVLHSLAGYSWLLAAAGLLTLVVSPLLGRRTR